MKFDIVENNGKEFFIMEDAIVMKAFVKTPTVKKNKDGITQPEYRISIRLTEEEYNAINEKFLTAYPDLTKGPAWKTEKGDVIYGITITSKLKPLFQRQTGVTDTNVMSNSKVKIQAKVNVWVNQEEEHILSMQLEIVKLQSDAVAQITYNHFDNDGDGIISDSTESSAPSKIKIGSKKPTIKSSPKTSEPVEDDEVVPLDMDEIQY